jgi:hypothetical protein
MVLLKKVPAKRLVQGAGSFDFLSRPLLGAKWWWSVILARLTSARTVVDPDSVATASMEQAEGAREWILAPGGAVAAWLGQARHATGDSETAGPISRLDSSV